MNRVFFRRIRNSGLATAILIVIGLFIVFAFGRYLVDCREIVLTDGILEIYKLQAPKRRKIHDEITSETNHYGPLYNNLAPEAHCPELVKVGSTDDGGKWMCSPAKVPEGCVIFSIGMNNEISFETHIQEISDKRCFLHGYDAGEQEAFVHKKFKAIKAEAHVAMLANKTNAPTKEYTIDALMRQSEVRSIEILKIDVEGTEFYIMDQFLRKHVVGQIMIEVHGSPKETIDFLRMIGRHDYLLVHYEINGAHTNLAEYTFMHISALDRYGAVYTARYLY